MENIQRSGLLKLLEQFRSTLRQSTPAAPLVKVQVPGLLSAGVVGR